MKVDIEIYQREYLSSGEIVHLYSNRIGRAAVDYSLVVIPVELSVMPRAVLRHTTLAECQNELADIIESDVTETM